MWVVSVHEGEVDHSGEGLAVNLVGEDAQGEPLVDSLVEAGEQLKQALTTAAHQHGVGAVFIGGGGDATDRAQHADGDLAVFDQLRDVGKRQGGNGTLRLGFLFTLWVLAGRWRRDSTEATPRCG